MDDTQHTTEPPLAPAPPAAAGRATLGWALADDRRLRAWMWLATSVLAVLLFAVSVPLAATLYGVHLLAAFATSLAMAGAIPLAVRFRWVAAGLATVGLLAFALLSAPSEGAPWPWPVTTIIGQFALLLVLGLMRMTWVGMFAAWLAGVVVTAPFAFVDAGAAANADRGRGHHRGRAADRAPHHPAPAGHRRALPRAGPLRLRAGATRARRGAQSHRPRAARRRGARPVDHPRAGDERAVPGRGAERGREGGVRRDRGIRSLGDDRDAPAPRGAPQRGCRGRDRAAARASATCRRSWPPSSAPACR